MTLAKMGLPVGSAEVEDDAERSLRLKRWLEQLKNPGEDIDLLQWFTRLRWLVSILQFISLIPALLLGFVDQSNILWYIFVMGLVPLYNVIFNYIYRKDSPWDFHPRQLVLVGLYFDLIQLSTLLAMTGGWNNPFSSLIFIYATLASMALRSQHSMIYGSVLIVDIVLLQKVFRRDIPNAVPWTQPFVDMVVESVVGVSLMMICGSLITKLFQQGEQVEHLKRARLRMDRLRAIGAISSGVCHQLATPLNNIGIRFDRIKRDYEGTDDDLIDNIESIQVSLKKAQSALKKLADIQVDPEKTVLETVDFGKLIDETADSWLRSENNGRIRIRSHDFPTYMVALPVGAVTQVVLDLLDNAAEAMDDKCGCVRLSLSHDDKYITFSIDDEGPGFPPEVLEYFGEPFNSQKVGGSGLGIYHAQLISQLLGGRLDVENLDKGARISFRISRKNYGR
ncbi:sensor histidine kinase [Pseudobacteriovorax antillogorgiicola]|uniref:histidine kinase n=1 Tax=Pseudobacteriovorax antillogorgiicola TaxID=1513793 RepID=A0A1Y6BBR5_9BACT|nr:HAMP domain-containing sensor histidine kinase [Pseudobacteriovorax antillogorgiicola]TCS57573.1 two-component system sensor histidine kinase RegB [Pseudobacteriovorax antillogorgiicola]SME99687.1 two-component system, sensor histidine kinase RegB [Pseudobacteriovorax antillogorgiicola]